MILTHKRLLIVLCIFLLCFVSACIYQLFIRQPALVSTEFYESNQRILVIDAGHGGPDGGAVGISGTIEKDINLSVALRCELLMDLAGISTVMIRREDISLHENEALSIGQKKVADIRRRVEIVQSLSSPVLLSIHMNSFPQSKYSGAQVFYSKNNTLSTDFAEILQSSLQNGVNPANQRAAKQVPNEVYLMKKVDCPAVIVECGFLSNREEEALLQTENYQKKLTLSIGAAALQFLCGDNKILEN